MNPQNPGWGPPGQPQNWPQPQQPVHAQHQQPGYPPQPGYPQQPGYPLQQGYPQQPGYPPQQPWAAPQSPPAYNAPPVPPHVRPASSGISGTRIALGVILIPVIVGTSWYVYTHVRSRSSGSDAPHAQEIRENGGVAKYVSDPGALVRSTQVLVDQDLQVKAHSYTSYPFTLPSSRPIKVIVTGKQDSAKGFSVYLMTDDEFALRRAEKDTKYHAGLSSMKSGDMEKTAELTAGNWNLVVENSENLLKTMTVHVKIVSDP